MRCLDGSNVGVHENGFHVGFTQSLDSLGAYKRVEVRRSLFSMGWELTRIVEFTGLTDAKTTRANDQHLFDIYKRDMTKDFFRDLGGSTIASWGTGSQWSGEETNGGTERGDRGGLHSSRESGKSRKKRRAGSNESRFMTSREGGTSRRCVGGSWRPGASGLEVTIHLRWDTAIHVHLIRMLSI